MSLRRDLRERARLALCGLAVALFPQPESSRLARQSGVDLPFWSFLIGVIEAPVGGLLFFAGAIDSVSETAPALSALLLENWFPELNEGHFMGAGLIGLLAWYLNPVAWLLALEGVTGACRVAAFAASREAVGEPLLWAGLRCGQLIHRSSRRRARLSALGPLRPDRLQYGENGRLEILSCREREEWLPGVALEVERRFFRSVEVAARPDGDHQVLVYRFQELDPNEVIRHPVPYQPLPCPTGDRKEPRHEPVTPADV
jgi:hypothetical protein